ncbi:MAG: MYG1 family protein [Polyangiaceae bacterium]|nr:MYG1 family protein [Polyangiaceae bacterium]
MPKKPQLIITHPGGAHKDDFLACCVLAAVSGAEIRRRVPTSEEVQNPLIATVDIGGSSEASLLNFDHHHFSRDHAPTCALSLVLKAYGLYDLARKHCDWLETAEWFDSRGPHKTAAWLGVERDVVARLNSPIDITLLRRFAKLQELTPGETLYEVMRWIGDDLLTFLKSVSESLTQLEKVVERFQVERDGRSWGAVLLPRTGTAGDEPSSSLGRWIREKGLEHEIAFLAYPDRRGTGYGLARYQDHVDVDFSQVSEEKDVHFAHVSGFVCKTSATEIPRLKELMAQALVPGSRPGE